MSKQLVFIDESGDAGLTGGKSSRFIIAAVVIMDENEDSLIKAKIIEYKRALGWHDKDEFKFSRTRKEIIKDLLKQLANYNFQVYSVVLDKHKNHAAGLNERYSLYNHVLAELIKSIPYGSMNICIDGDVGKKYRKNTLTLLRKQLGNGVHITGFKYADSKTVEELQLADIVVGSINRSYSVHPDAKDYIKLIKKKIVKIQEL